jgi:hypothetical protein
VGEPREKAVGRARRRLWSTLPTKRVRHSVVASAEMMVDVQRVALMGRFYRLRRLHIMKWGGAWVNQHPISDKIDKS